MSRMITVPALALVASLAACGKSQQSESASNTASFSAPVLVESMIVPPGASLSWAYQLRAVRPVYSLSVSSTCRLVTGINAATLANPALGPLTRRGSAFTSATWGRRLDLTHLQLVFSNPTGISQHCTVTVTENAIAFGDAAK